MAALTTPQLTALLLFLEFCLFVHICVAFPMARKRFYNFIHSVEIFLLGNPPRIDTSFSGFQKMHQERKDERKANREKEKPVKRTMSYHIR